jgi:hypothetical protein
MIKMLRERNIDIIDCAPIFMAMKSKDALYQKKDTHWDGNGIVIAAKLISDEINLLLRWEGGEGEVKRYSFKDTIVLKSGDLAEHLGDTSLYPKACRIITAQDGSPFKDSVWSDIMIFGDSFCMENRAFGGDIGAQIAYFINRPTFTIAHLDPYFGSGLNAPSHILTFLNNRRKYPKVIVWVMTSRDFCDKIY